MKKETITSGICRVCGQSVFIGESTAETSEEANEQATFECNCEEGAQGRQLMKAEIQIAELFEEEIVPFIKSAVEHVLYDELDSVTIKINGGAKCSVKMDSKGKINISRTLTDRDQLTI